MDENQNIEQNFEGTSTEIPSQESGAVLSSSEIDERKDRLAAFGDVTVEVSAVLGTVNMHIEQFLKLGRGAIIELERHKEEHIDLYVNGRIVAKGEVMVVKDNVGVSVTKIVKKKRKLAAA